MGIPGECFFKMSNAVFCYGLTPIQLAVYSYLVCRAGQNERCWPSMKTIAACCGCSKNAAREATKVLKDRGFISKVNTYRSERTGLTRQTNNTYYILELPPLPKPAPRAEYREGTADGEEMNHPDADIKFKASPGDERRTA
ncbi:MAG: helix-turn-helix domain-containing protein [Oscillospiraceae bacterium]|jgi:hypothetical protein